MKKSKFFNFMGSLLHSEVLEMYFQSLKEFHFKNAYFKNAYFLQFLVIMYLLLFLSTRASSKRVEFDRDKYYVSNCNELRMKLQGVHPFRFEINTSFLLTLLSRIIIDTISWDILLILSLVWPQYWYDILIIMLIWCINSMIEMTFWYFDNIILVSLIKS
jgi:hypothetical protein